jgi:hypothetical protein
MEIIVDPAQEAQDLEHQRLQELAQAREKKIQEDASRRAGGKTKADRASSLESSQTPGTTSTAATSTASGIGKYLSATALKQSDNDDTNERGTSSESLVLPPPVKQKSTVKATKFGDFSSW